MLFLKAFSWETNLWVTVGDFTLKKCKSGKRNLYVTESQLRRDKIWCEADNHNNNMCHICAKELYDLNFNQAVIYKISNFNEIAPNLTYTYNWNLLDQLLLSYKFHGRDMSGIYLFFFFSIFASCELLSQRPDMNSCHLWREYFLYKREYFPKGLLQASLFKIQMWIDRGSTQPRCLFIDINRHGDEMGFKLKVNRDVLDLWWKDGNWIGFQLLVYNINMAIYCFFNFQSSSLFDTNLNYFVTFFFYNNISILRGNCTSNQKNSMFCAWSENYQHLFEKYSMLLIVNCPRNSKIALKFK